MSCRVALAARGSVCIENNRKKKLRCATRTLRAGTEACNHMYIKICITCITTCITCTPGRVRLETAFSLPFHDFYFFVKRSRAPTPFIRCPPPLSLFLHFPPPFGYPHGTSGNISGNILPRGPCCIHRAAFIRCKKSRLQEAKPPARSKAACKPRWAASAGLPLCRDPQRGA